MIVFTSQIRRVMSSDELSDFLRKGFKTRVLFIATESVVRTVTRAPSLGSHPGLIQVGQRSSPLRDSPCVFMCFFPQKHLKGKTFNSDGDLKDAEKVWVSSLPQKFREQVILRLVKWDRCVQAYGIYFE
ncbi:hypothetical protein TNIN_459271 [Trichonephila inaurata madagascariensis]|uniref:Uncharacterized protein n=1 Tax=Trichonephila inaurata madagascariensis TaxID=2747483 RepID=A0A8X6J6X5_9ARAC|nr:hypothetical protein TNIN_459271 [Trichonephila inaurata madagascariensis]